MGWQDSVLACPSCKSVLENDESRKKCSSCHKSYELDETVPVFLSLEKTKQAATRSNFWDQGWRQRLSVTDHSDLITLDKASLTSRVRNAMRTSLVDTIYTVEANANSVGEKIVLDIGCGGGFQGPLFALYGAKYIGLDFSVTAAKETSRKLNVLDNKGITVNAAAECLPIKSSTIDIVFSHGVLHHTPDIVEACKEVQRCLKPDGVAYIALYSTFSPLWLLIRLRGMIRAFFSKNKKARKWFHLTEEAWIVGDDINPWTKTFSKNELIDLAQKSGFQVKRIRRSGFECSHLSARFFGWLNKTPIGRLAEKKLSPYLGNMWCLTLVKS